jgi:hypothetical protein
MDGRELRFPFPDAAESCSWRLGQARLEGGPHLLLACRRPYRSYEAVLRRVRDAGRVLGENFSCLVQRPAPWHDIPSSGPVGVHNSCRVISEGSRPTWWPRELKRWSRPEVNLPTSPHRRVVRNPGPEGDPSTVIALRGFLSSSSLRYVEHDTQLQPWKAPAAAEPVLGGTKRAMSICCSWNQSPLRLCVKRVGAVGGAAREPRDRPTKIDLTPATQHHCPRQPIESPDDADPLYWLLVSEDRQPRHSLPGSFLACASEISIADGRPAHMQTRDCFSPDRIRARPCFLEEHGHVLRTAL